MPFYACDAEYLQNNYTAFFLSIGGLTLDDIMSIDGSKMTVNIKGPLYKSKYNLISDALDLASDNQIKQVDLQMDTPGGSVDPKLDYIWQQIYNLRQDKKVTAYNNGMVASAGYWIASAANKIVSNGALSVNGSIGVYYSEVDYTQYDQRNGVNVITMRSKNATYKNLSAAESEGNTIIQAQLDEIEDLMLTRIAAGRSISKKLVIAQYGQGATFLSKTSNKDYIDAYQRGMIDKVINNNITRENKVTNKEIKTMYETLEDAYKEHPELKSFVIAAIDAAVTKSRIDLMKDHARLADYFSSEDYPKPIKDQIVRYLKGEITSVESIDSAILAVDAVKAQMALSSASVESASIAPTVSAETVGTVISNDGQVRSDDDYKRANDEMKILKGVK